MRQGRGRCIKERDDIMTPLYCSPGVRPELQQSWVGKDSIVRITVIDVGRATAKHLRTLSMKC